MQSIMMQDKENTDLYDISNADALVEEHRLSKLQEIANLYNENEETKKNFLTIDPKYFNTCDELIFSLLAREYKVPDVLGFGPLENYFVRCWIPDEVEDEDFEGNRPPPQLDLDKLPQWKFYQNTDKLKDFMVQCFYGMVLRPPDNSKLHMVAEAFNDLANGSVNVEKYKAYNKSRGLNNYEASKHREMCVDFIKRLRTEPLTPIKILALNCWATNVLSKYDWFGVLFLIDGDGRL